jgi:PhnB protein
MHVYPYLSFNGRCDEAIEFYKHAVGAKASTLMRFKDSPDQNMIKPGIEDKIMHARLQIGDATVMASDGHCTGSLDFKGISLTLSVANEAESNRLFNALSDGGKVLMPLTKTFFSPSFGMLEDRFGVTWMVIVES